MKEKRAQDTYNRFAFCHQNEALLYQFFLNECLLAFRKVEKGKVSKELLIQLAGNEREFSPWRSRTHLEKMENYYGLMLTHFADPTTTTTNPALIKKLGQSLQRALLVSRECLQNFVSSLDEAEKLFNELKIEIKKIGSFLIEKIGDYRTSEQVLYFILKSFQELDLLYGEKIIAKTFLNLFPGGIHEAGIFITNNYAKKGYQHLIPSIEEGIRELAKHVP